MALFWATIKRNSVSLLKFPFRSHVQVFSREISPICRLKYPYSCFSSQFCFRVFVVLFILVLSVLFLVVVISLFFFFQLFSSSMVIFITNVLIVYSSAFKCIYCGISRVNRPTWNFCFPYWLVLSLLFFFFFSFFLLSYLIIFLFKVPRFY